MHAFAVARGGVQAKAAVCDNSAAFIVDLGLPERHGLVPLGLLVRIGRHGGAEERVAGIQDRLHDRLFIRNVRGVCDDVKLHQQPHEVATRRAGVQPAAPFELGLRCLLCDRVSHMHHSDLVHVDGVHRVQLEAPTPGGLLPIWCRQTAALHGARWQCVRRLRTAHLLAPHGSCGRGRDECRPHHSCHRAKGPEGGAKDEGGGRVVKGRRVRGSLGPFTTGAKMA
mmetsp:Transcript_96679/g.242527  ORF Transcript_96679/g.242527 Transcript_96679/m.242527 type:complete len:225 (+) Transcript_96679:1117-1791(+)